jgi:hypothetical protein
MVLVALAVAIISSTARAQNCNLSGKTMTYSYSTCNYNNIECTNGMQEKIIFLGEKILRSAVVTPQSGEVYYRNRTVDKLADELQDRQFLSTAPPGTTQKWSLTAEAEGTNLILTQRALLLNNMGATVMTVLWQRAFRIFNCSSCQMTSYRFAGDRPGGRRIDFHLVNQSCSIGNN